MGDYRGFGGMEDYRRAEIAPYSNVNTYGQERPGADGLTDKQRVDKVRADFLANSQKHSQEHSDIRRDALSRALLSAEQVRGKRTVCGMSEENYRQVMFTLLLISSSIAGTIASSLETSFIGHLGKNSMAARSITFSIMNYFYGITNMWAAISTKIGRAVGARNNAAIAKYFKMAIILAFASGVFTWSILYPFGPWMMRHFYTLKPATYDLAWPYMCKCKPALRKKTLCSDPCCRTADLHAMGQPLDYLNGVGNSVLQGLQQLKYYVAMGFTDRILLGLSNWLAIKVLGFGINGTYSAIYLHPVTFPIHVDLFGGAGSAVVHVMRNAFMIFLIYGYLYRWFKNDVASPSVSAVWG